jgi:putative membrane protein
MYTRRQIRWTVIWNFGWRKVLLFSIWGALVTWLWTLLMARGIDISIPIAPLGTIGVAVAFYVGFKNNQSYDRYWEARKVWGGIVNVSRTFANQVLSYVSADHSNEAVEEIVVREARQTLIYRHLAWMHGLRYQLRRKTPWGFTPKGYQRKYAQSTDLDAMKKQLADLLPDTELKVSCEKANFATQVLRYQGDHLRIANDQLHLIEEFRFIDLMNSLKEMYTLQGKCERIKNTPFPRQYAYFSEVFVTIFVAMLPLGIISQFAGRNDATVWLTVPLSVVISWIFFTMESVGDASEDPFENFINDVPLTTICRGVEIDLRQMLDETDIPAPLQPVDDILM